MPAGKRCMLLPPVTCTNRHLLTLPRQAACSSAPTRSPKRATSCARGSARRSAAVEMPSPCSCSSVLWPASARIANFEQQVGVSKRREVEASRPHMSHSHPAVGITPHATPVPTTLAVPGTLTNARQRSDGQRRHKGRRLCGRQHRLIVWLVQTTAAGEGQGSLRSVEVLVCRPQQEREGQGRLRSAEAPVCTRRVVGLFVAHQAWQMHGNRAGAAGIAGAEGIGRSQLAQGTRIAQLSALTCSAWPAACWLPHLPMRGSRLQCAPPPGPLQIDKGSA